MPLKTVADAIAELRARPSLEKRIRPVKSRLHVIKRAEAVRTKLDRAALRRTCKPENAQALATVLPGPDSTVHALITGDFVFGDLLAAIVDRHGPPREMLITTLSLSMANVAMLTTMLHRSPGDRNEREPALFRKPRASNHPQRPPAAGVPPRVDERSGPSSEVTHADHARHRR